MKDRLVMALCLLAVIALSSLPSFAAESSATYVGGTIDGNGVAGPLVDGVGVAGYIFELSYAPRYIKIADATEATGIGWAVCQDDGDGVCGLGNDIVQEGCSTGGFQTLSGFGARETTIFIDSLSVDCEGSATTGTLTLRSA